FSIRRMAHGRRGDRRARAADHGPSLSKYVDFAFVIFLTYCLRLMTARRRNGKVIDLIARTRVRRREFMSLIAGAAATWPLAAHAQQPTFQVGFLYPGPQAAASPRIAAYSSGLQAGGIRPQQVDIIARMTDGDAAPLAPMAADLVARKVDVIAAISPAAVRAAQAATATIPIVAGDLESDPVASGFAASIARPGGNITGVFLDFLDFSKKWLEALKEAVPQMAQVAVFWDPATGPMQRQAVEAAAQTL